MRKLFKYLISLILLLFVSVLNAQLIYEYEGSRNLSSSPISITGLKGDTYDYHYIIFVDTLGTTTGNLDVTLNSDTGTNYNRYYMRGLTTTASANVTTSAVSMRLTNVGRQASGLNTLAMGSLTGSSGDERKMSCMYGAGNNAQVYVYDYYWTNTVDEVTSMTFTGTVSASYTWHILVYQTVKIKSQNSWTLIDQLNWSSESTEKSFTVDGDADIQYMIQWDGDKSLLMQCNNDGGANYTSQRLVNSSGTLTSANNTGLTNLTIGDYNLDCIINAKSGVDRLIYSSASKTSAAHQRQSSHWWQNTASNLTSLDLTPQASSTGTAKLYKRKQPYVTADKLPFTTIKTFAVSGDYSAGDTLSGLNLDSYKMVKIEWLGANTSGNDALKVQFNGDAGSNYARQYLRANTGTASAASSTAETFLNLTLPRSGEQCSGVMYLYPKSGEYRPTLTVYSADESFINFTAGWYQESATEITSIKLFNSSTSSMSGEIRISVLK